jgi:hypothetical protein
MEQRARQVFNQFTNEGKDITEANILKAIQHAMEYGMTNLSERLPVRPAVKWYAERMEETLKRNDHKGGWRRCDLQYLSMRLTQERKELAEAIASKDNKRIINECTDVANFSLMLADKFGNNYGG